MMSWYNVLLAVGAASAAVLAVFVLAGSPPVRWLLSRLVAAPIREVLDERIDERVAPRFDELLAELRPNHGRSLRDVIDARFDHIEARLAVLERDVAQAGEIDELGRGGRIDRRGDGGP